MGPPKRKSGKRRLADMNAAEPARPWYPELEPEWPPWEDTFYIDQTVRYVQRLGVDEYDRLAEFAVVQMRLVGGQWRRVAVYDTCHNKGLHVHLYDRHEREFTEVPLRPVASYQDMDDCLAYALQRVTEHWQDNERRSDRGC